MPIRQARSAIWCGSNSNADGLQNHCEDGIAGVTVNLIGAGADGTFDTEDDQILSTTTTDTAGAYHFNNLAPGSYEVQVIAPIGYHFSTSFQGSNTGLDSNTNAPVTPHPLR